MRHAEGMTGVQSKSKKTKRQKMDARSGGREVETRKGSVLELLGREDTRGVWGPKSGFATPSRDRGSVEDVASVH
jgi:hypothetical protein